MHQIGREGPEGAQAAKQRAVGVGRRAVRAISQPTRYFHSLTSPRLHRLKKQLAGQRQHLIAMSALQWVCYWVTQAPNEKNKIDPNDPKCQLIRPIKN